MERPLRVVAAFSGGLDSTVLLAHLLDSGCTVTALSVDYGQRHRRELEAASRIAKALWVPLVTVDLSGLRVVLSGSSQTDETVPVPDGHYAAESMKTTVVPNRNMMLLAAAGALAVSQKFDGVSYAAHGGDHAIYPDCRPDFAHAMSKVLSLCDWHALSLMTPFIRWSKADIVKRGSALRVPFRMTYSCYKGEEFHCGTCGTCTERREAFREAGVHDPTTYRT